MPRSWVGVADCAYVLCCMQRQCTPGHVVHVHCCFFNCLLLQDTIEGKLEKRAKGVFVPAGGKRLIAFIDDLNMPKKSKFGFIPPLELLKLWVDNGFW